MQERQNVIFRSIPRLHLILGLGPIGRPDLSLVHKGFMHKKSNQRKHVTSTSTIVNSNEMRTQKLCNLQKSERHVAKKSKPTPATEASSSPSLPLSRPKLLRQLHAHKRRRLV